MRIIIVGGGCSGVCSAINAKKDNNEVIILERGDMLLKKILMTGNGKCNYYNEDQDLSHYHTNSGDVSNYITENNLALVNSFFNKLGIIPYIKNGYYYPSSKEATTIRDALLSKVREKQITIKYNYLVESITKENDKYVINHDLVCDKLVVATGSFAYPKTGSDGMGYEFLKELNYEIIPVLPSLVPLTSNMPFNKELSGVRCDAVLTLYIDGKEIKKEQGELQLTDYGISGICTFNLSYYASRALKNHQVEIKVNFVQFIKKDINTWFNNYRNTLGNIKISEMLNRFLPKKLVPVILKVTNIKDIYYDELDNHIKNLLFNNLTEFCFNITGTKDYDKAQVCSGGISLSEINPNNFNTYKDPNLYILGELLDLTGDCGGYNLTICWISGILSGRSLGEDYA